MSVAIANICMATNTTQILSTTASSESRRELSGEERGRGGGTRANTNNSCAQGVAVSWLRGRDRGWPHTPIKATGTCLRANPTQGHLLLLLNMGHMITSGQLLTVIQQSAVFSFTMYCPRRGDCSVSLAHCQTVMQGTVSRDTWTSCRMKMEHSV